MGFLSGLFGVGGNVWEWTAGNYRPGEHLDGVAGGIPILADLAAAIENGRERGTPPTHFVVGLAPAYVVAHEVAHHVQNVLGISDEVRALQQQNPSQANDYSVRLELQADCFAGVWASTLYVDPTGSAEVGGQGLIELDPGEVSEALEAAAAVGDDRIQEATTGRIDPEKFSHGTSAQRQDWFNRGYQTGDPNQCDTFSADL